MSAGPKWLVTVDSHGFLFHVERYKWREVLDIARSYGVPLPMGSLAYIGRGLQLNRGGLNGVEFSRGPVKVTITNLHKGGRL